MRVSALRPLFAVLCLATLSGPAAAASLLMISVDGMKPEYVTEADTLGLKIPYLRSLLANGAFAEGVQGVWPTNTYPSHTTLLTGVTPAEHGIYTNGEFDPRRKFAESWYWYTRQIKVPTLWQVARQAGLRTASVGWPVSVGAVDVDFLIPEYWRVLQPTGDLNPSDRHLIDALSRPEGLIEHMQQTLGPYLMGNDVSLAADETKTRFAIDILRRHKPRFMTVHLSSLDAVEHDHGPFSQEANHDLEAIDGMLSRLISAARGEDSGTIVLVVSDHGFTPLKKRVNLSIPFIKAGLVDVSVDAPTQAPTIRSWTAIPWPASGMAAIMLRDPDDQATVARVRVLLETLKADPELGIAEVLDAPAISSRGAFPGASFLVSMQPGCYAGGGLGGDLVTDASGHGGHGFAPSYPEMRAAFFMEGPGIARHRDLGVVDMRQVAPTVARVLGLTMPSAKAVPLPVRQ